jgi:chaperonin GroES
MTNDTPALVDGLPTSAPALPVDFNRIRPTGQRVVVKLVETEIKTKNGVIIPSKLNESFNRIGRVLSIGTGWFEGTRYPMFVKPGDICFFQLEQQQAMNTAYVDREHGMVFFLHNLDMIGVLSEPSLDLGKGADAKSFSQFKDHSSWV